MEDLITSYLIQTKDCGLPLLGSFKVKEKSASLDIAVKKMFAPISEIVFSEAGDYLPENLIHYISAHQKISSKEAEQKLHNWCLAEKARLDAGQKITFDSIGTLQKNETGNIFFREENVTSLYETLPAERVIHKNDEHVVLVGDKETTSAAMNEFYRDDAIVIEKKSTWKILALILFILSLLVLCFYFYDHDFSENTIGNQLSFPASTPAGTYAVPK